MDYRYNFENKKKHNLKRIIFVIVTIILVIIFVSFFFKDSSNKIVSTISSKVVYPFEKIYEFSGNLVTGIKTYFSDKDKLYKENEELKNEVESLKYELLESQKILDENTSLKQMLEIKKAFQHFNLKMGKIIYREHDNWTQSFKLDIGKNDGVSLNQAVVDTNGLVGYVSSVEDTTCTVTTILDPSTSVSVSISTINEPAILKGDLNLKSNNRLNLTYIPLDAQISIDDMLYTSGLGETYPASIPVGKIIEIEKNKNDINRYAIVEPCVNIRTISEVGVIIN